MLPLILLLLCCYSDRFVCVRVLRSIARLRIALGILAIATTAFGACAVNHVLTTFNYNVSYGTATKKLVRTLIAQIEGGHLDRVLESWRKMDMQYEGTYETPPSQYVGSVEEAVARMAGGRPTDARPVKNQTAPK